MKRIALVMFILFSAVNGMAATFICRVQPGVDIHTVAAGMNATVLDSIPDDPRTYLLSAAAIPNFARPGVEYVEANVAVAIPKQTFTIFSKSVTSSTAMWYQQQPAMKLVSLQSTLKVSKGRGIVIADINAAVDYGHPALIGHLTGGSDFVAPGQSGSGSLDQSSSSFLDQSSASFLDQSSASFLDQSSAAFLDQSTASFLDSSTASFLDQSSASFLDSGKPAHGHGTLVAGILAAMAPESLIMPLRAFDDSGSGDAMKIAKAIRYAARNGATVINMSFGLTEPSKTVDAAIDFAVKSGVVLVASAGNSNSVLAQYPAANAQVMSVTATTLKDAKASFSNFGPTVYVAAPGVNIVSAYPGGYYAVVSGTSFASPMVSAEAALILSHTGSLGSSISTGVVNIDKQNRSYLGQLGSGRIDFSKAVGK
jgi:subtilisin family serine protease